MSLTTQPPTVLKIGIHFRAGDAVLEGRTGSDESVGASFSTLFHCAKEIEKWVFEKEKGKYGSAVWYVISDNHSFRQKALQEYGPEKVITSTNATILHSSHALFAQMHHLLNVSQAVIDAGLHQAAAEWWLFGMMDFHIGYRTGFASSSSSRLPYQNNLYLVSQTPKCGENDFIPLKLLRNYLPGI